MLVLLAIFAIVSCAMPAMRRIPRNGMFIVAALVAAGATGWLIAIAPSVFAGLPYTESIAWIPELGMNLEFRIDELSWVLAMIVTGIGALVLLYCARYFDADEPDLGRFGGVLLGFAGVMLGLVTADNIYLMFVFWEGTSILSYLLIGHYTGRRAARGAALQALLTTTLGGLAMLVGLVMLHVAAGSPELSTILAADIPHDGYLITAVMLVLAGAATKSALAPFHFWLPGAMAAPTPVSAYLHAASMVKAGIYLILRLSPSYADLPGFREVLITLGLATMLIGAWRSLRQFDLKLILAFGTVSQLGFMAVIAGFGTRDAALAALAMVISHALFKAALFLIVGIIDHCAGTRDIRKLSGLGKQTPFVAALAVIAGGSMVGLPPLWGFVAKEGAFGSFLHAWELGDLWGAAALIGTAIGSILTFAYTMRFLYGAFANKKDARIPIVEPQHKPALELTAPVALVLLTIALPWFASAVDKLVAGFADQVPALDPAHPAHLALWHGWELPLLVSAITVAVGLLLFWLRNYVEDAQSLVPDWFEAARGYWGTMRAVDIVAARVTAATQRGSLPFYLASIFVVTIVSVAIGASGVRPEVLELEPRLDWASIAIVGMMAIAAIAATMSTKRFQGLVLVGVTGYGMAAIFAISGAPDLATTQALIETITLVVFVLVLRRLPARHAKLENNLPSWMRWLIGGAVGLAIGIAATIALGARTHPSDGLAFPELAVKGGHGENFVNVTLVDIRGWDTMGELLVLVAAATGIASLVYLRTRASQREPGAPLPKEPKHEERGAVWLLAGRSIDPAHRSIVVEVVVRLVFHAMLIVSLFLLFSGHNDPGGGFAGGVVAALALAARYLAGGRRELDQAVRVDAGWLLGVGVLFAGGAVLAPMLFGHAPFTSFWIDEQLPGIGHFVFVTSTVFDIGVYLIVIGLAIDILRTLGSELDEQAEEEDLLATDVGAMVLDEAEVRGATPSEMPVTRRIPTIVPPLKRGERR